MTKCEAVTWSGIRRVTEGLRACDKGRTDAIGMTETQIARKYGSWLLANAADRLTPEQIDACAEAEPFAAMYYAANLLTPERRATCAAKNSADGRAYVRILFTPERLDTTESIAARLIPERVEAFANSDVITALRYTHKPLTPKRFGAYTIARRNAIMEFSAGRLVPERIDACAKAEPYIALRYMHNLLTPERLDACAAMEPHIALQYARNLLTPERRALCEKS